MSLAYGYSKQKARQACGAACPNSFTRFLVSHVRHSETTICQNPSDSAHFLFFGPSGYINKDVLSQPAPSRDKWNPWPWAVARLQRLTCYDDRKQLGILFLFLTHWRFYDAPRPAKHLQHITNQHKEGGWEGGVKPMRGEILQQIGGNLCFVLFTVASKRKNK